jgi:hypothetical protein
MSSQMLPFSMAFYKKEGFFKKKTRSLTNPVDFSSSLRVMHFDF